MNTNQQPRQAISYIRFSSRKQRFGVSVQRQVDETRAFCHRHNLILDELKSIKDLGVSAYHSKNTDEGNLGLFMEAVKSGIIQTPVVLVVEALDRLTRDKITDAMNLLLTLLRMGVSIGLISDNKIYSKEYIDANNMELIIAFSYLTRGHDESRMKSLRTNDAVTRMIENIKNNKPCNLGGYLPPWYKFNKDKQVYVLSEDKANIVRKVFNLYLSGKGTTTIVKILKQNKVPKWNNTEGRNAPWKAGGIRSMLRNKQVIGIIKLRGNEYNVLPAIVDINDYNKVQILLDKNTNRHGKHTSNYIANLFNGLIFCSSCSHSLAVHKSSHKTYFHCLHSRDYNCKDKTYWSANEVELSIFGIFLKNAPSILIAEKDKSINKEIEGMEATLKTLENKKAKILAMIDDPESKVEELKQKMAENKRRIIETNKKLNELRIKANTLISIPRNFNTFINLINQDLTNNETRQQIKNILPSVVKRIEVNLAENNLSVEMTNGEIIKYASEEQTIDIETSIFK